MLAVLVAAEEQQLVAAEEEQLVAVAAAVVQVLRAVEEKKVECVHRWVFWMLALCLLVVLSSVFGPSLPEFFAQSLLL